MLRYFTDTQTGIQTATTKNFRQINLIFPIFCGIEVGNLHWLNETHKAISTQSDQMLLHLYIGQAIHNSAIHYIVDQMVELAIRGS